MRHWNQVGPKRRIDFRLFNPKTGRDQETLQRKTGILQNSVQQVSISGKSQRWNRTGIKLTCLMFKTIILHSK